MSGRPDSVVIGGSFAGCCAAAAIASAGLRVTVVERDPLPARPAVRPGVSQAAQPHVLLQRGLRALEDLLPGITQDLLAAGAVSFGSGELVWLSEFGWLPLRPSGFQIVSMSRALLEHVVRERVRALPGVTFVERARVTSLRRAGGDAGGGWDVELDAGTLTTPLVVDASGRASRLPEWLAAAGLPQPTVDEVDARAGYASQIVQPVVELPPTGIFLNLTPRHTVAAVAIAIEDGRWIVCGLGLGPDRPPRNAAGLRAFLASVRDPAVADLLALARPVTDVAVHRRTSNQWRHYERLRGWPPGLLVVGDALAAFSPVYGQGLTVAAREAVLLRHALMNGRRPGWERRLLRRFRRVLWLPWAIATGEDVKYSTCTRGPTLRQRAFRRWTDEIGRLTAHGDLRTTEYASRVYHLIGSPALLVHPAVIASVLRAHVRGYGPLVPRPALLDQLRTARVAAAAEAAEPATPPAPLLRAEVCGAAAEQRSGT